MNSEGQLREVQREFRDFKAALDEHSIVAVTDPRGRITAVNDKFCAISKYSRTELLGQDHRIINSGCHPKVFFQEMWSVISSGRIWHGEIKNRAKDGSHYWVDTTIVPFLDEGGKPRSYVAIRTDISERRRHEMEIERLNRMYAALSHVNQAIVRTTSRNVLFHDVCRAVVNFGGFKMAWIGWHEPAGDSLKPVAYYGDNPPDEVPLSEEKEQILTPPGTAFRELRPCVCNDLTGGFSAVIGRQQPTQSGFLSAAFFPITCGGAACGILGVYADEVDFFQTKEVALLAEAAHDLSFALDNFVRDERRHAAELALQESEGKFRTLIEQASEGIFLADAQGRFREINPRGCGLLGRSHLSLLQLGLGDVLESSGQPEDLDAWMQNPKPREWVFRRENGENFPGEISAQRLPDGNLLGILRDVTERRKALADQVRLVSIVNSSDDAIIGKGLDGVITSWNPGAERVFGYTAPEAIGKPVLLLIPPDRKNEEEDILVRVSRGERVRHFETVRVRKDGARIIVSVSISPITDSSGKVVGASKIARDITRRRLAEEALAASEERFRQMAENIDEVFWMTDTAKQQMLYVSPAYERIWGRPCGELNLSALSWTDSIVAEDRERVKAAAVRQAEGTYREEYRILRPDGTIRWILDRAFPIRDSAGQIYRIVGVAEDITEKRKLEEQFLRAQRMEAIGALASGLSHDLNNILAPVLMVPSVLRAKLESEKDRDLLGLLEKSAQRGANLIRQLLLFSRGASGQKIPVQLSHLIKEMVVVMRETFPREISIAVEPAANVGPVRGDPTQFHQVLMNLCVNARDAMPTGGKLTLGLKNVELPADDRRHPQARPGHYVVLTVSDTGEGMTPEIQARIFDPFFTTKELGKGTGLGLSTVAAIVKSHEGFVTVYSEPGRGTAFHVYLPAESSTVAPNENQKPEVAPKGNGELVLLVDDEEPVTAATRLILEQNNYRVLVAHNGKQAISLFLEYQDGLRLVLTDVMMPIMGGVALARALRAISPNLPIIATSGLEDEKRQTELTEVGIREILYKPCSSTELLFAVKRELDRN